jgi:2'-5' RNA ligase
VNAVGRAFVAVVPPPEVLDAIAAAVAPVSGSDSKVRWATREQWHVTLQFLGNHVELDAAAGALRGLAVHGDHVRVGGAGAFPNAERGRVLWLGFTTGVELFGELSDAVGAALAPVGFEPEARSLHPHITVARRKVPGDVRETTAALDAPTYGPAWFVHEVVLVQSFTKPTGAEHVPYARIPLATKPRDASSVG